MDSIFDYTDGDFCFGMNDNMAMDTDGHLLARMSDNSAIDLETGELHITSSWPDSSPWDDEDND